MSAMFYHARNYITLYCYNPKEMIKAIIFDLGGVILQPEGFTPTMLAQIFGVSPDQVLTVYNQVLEDKWGIGKITASQIIIELKVKFPTSKPTQTLVKKLQQMYLEQTKIDQEILNLIDSLHKNYSVYLLTNTVGIQSQVNKKRGIYSHFDKVYESYLLGIKKPNKKIYEFVVSDINAKTQECFL